MNFEIINKEHAYGGFFKILRVKLQHQLFRGGMSKEIVRELFERGNSVSVLMHDPVMQVVVLVKQFRVGAIASGSPWIIELPAGMVEAGETPYEVAVRESVEETGIEPEVLYQIAEFYNSVGGSSEKTTLFYAQVDASKVQEFSGLATENEDIQVLVVPQDEFLTNVKMGSYKTSSLLIGGFWLINKISQK